MPSRSQASRPAPGAPARARRPPCVFPGFEASAEWGRARRVAGPRRQPPPALTLDAGTATHEQLWSGGGLGAAWLRAHPKAFVDLRLPRPANCPVVFVNSSFVGHVRLSGVGAAGHQPAHAAGHGTAIRRRARALGARHWTRASRHACCVRNYRPDGSLFWNEMVVASRWPQPGPASSPISSATTRDASEPPQGRGAHPRRGCQPGCGKTASPACNSRAYFRGVTAA